MIWGDDVLIALRTTVTPSNIQRTSVERQIDVIKQDYLEADRTKPALARVVDFNKAVRSEFGLVLYLADVKSKDLVTSVSVTN